MPNIGGNPYIYCEKARLKAKNATSKQNLTTLERAFFESFNASDADIQRSKIY